MVHTDAGLIGAGIATPLKAAGLFWPPPALIRLSPLRKLAGVALIVLFVCVLPPNVHAATLLHDDFRGNIASSGNWHIPTWLSSTDGTFVGRTQFRCTQNSPLPAAKNSNALITVQSYNPTGFSFYGTDLLSNQSFTLGQGLDIKVRAKMNTSTPGIVGGIFLYALKPGSTTLHDEIDFELLTNLPGKVQTNIYTNEPLGKGDPQSVSYPSGSINDYHTYEIKWLPDQVSWFIDGNLVRSDTSNVPVGPMIFHLNIWAPDSGWPEAYSAEIQPTNSAGSNRMFSMSVDWVDIQSITPPMEVPGAPTGVTASAGSAQATVSFLLPVSNGGSPITGYTVVSSPDGITARGAGSPIIVKGLTNGTAYTFTVAAKNKIGTGQASAPSISVTPVGPTVHGAPTGVSATAGNARATVTFTAPASNGGSPITGYTVTSNPGGKVNSGKSSPITVKGLTNGTGYTFTVTAKNKVGTGQASEPSDSVIPATIPGAPTGVTATPGDSQATVEFTAPASTGGLPITSYTVTASPGGITAQGASSPINFTGLTNGKAYAFTVKATNAVGTGAASKKSKKVTPRQIGASVWPGGTNQIAKVKTGGHGAAREDTLAFLPTGTLIEKAAPLTTSEEDRFQENLIRCNRTH